MAQERLRCAALETELAALRKHVAELDKELESLRTVSVKHQAHTQDKLPHRDVSLMPLSTAVGHKPTHSALPTRTVHLPLPSVHC